MEHRRKILYVITKSNWGGAQRYLFDLITSIPGNEFEKKVLFGKSGDKSGLDARIKAAAKAEHISFEYLPQLERDINLVKELGSFLHLYRAFKRERPSIVHLNSSKAGGLGALAARLAGVPRIIFTAHGWPFLEGRDPLQRGVIKFLSWITVLLAHRTIALHEKDFRAFDGLPFTKGKLVKIYNGIRDEAGLSRAEAREALTKYGVDKKKPVIGTVGELHSNKGHSYLLEAFASLSQDAQLVLIGDGEEREKLEALARSLGIEKRVFFTGFEDGPKYMRGFDLFVLPSVKEGFPFVILEAGARGVPVVATAVGGVPEIVRTGDTGLLVSPKEPDELAQALTLMLRDPSIGKRYASALAEKVRREFQFETSTLPQTLALYRE